MNQNARMNWKRLTKLSAPPVGESEETWLCEQGSEVVIEAPMRIQTGKPLNLAALKGTDLAATCAYAQEIRTLALKLFGGSTQPIEECPCCGETERHLLGVINTANFVECSACGHVYTDHMPVAETREGEFSENESLSATYVDPASAEVRIREVVYPKRDWMLKHFVRLRGRAAKSVLDVGAGGGHFVQGCLDGGLEARGIEVSAMSRRFAKAAFGLELSGSDFLSDAQTRSDVVTMWGLLEYVECPIDFIIKARELMPEMLVVEVPRGLCGSSAAQLASPATVARHLDPATHVNTFSDESLATLLVRGGFLPVAAWYFGMDAYEILVQAAIVTGRPDLLAKAGSWITQWQPYFDRAYFCDDLIVAAVPLP